jgi:hypothetical protein
MAFIVKAEDPTYNPSETRYFDENGDGIYPCRCGETHRGPYGIYDYGHHNCFHTKPLVTIRAEVGYYCCPDCGLTFFLKDAMELAMREGRLTDGRTPPP